MKDDLFEDYKKFRTDVLSWLNKEQLISLILEQEYLIKKARDRVKAYQKQGVKYA
jgi:hypothetical protein